MNNAQHSVVMFGGDLSWADDYKHVIKELTHNTIKVTIIFPISKIKDLSHHASVDFCKRVDDLRHVGGNVLYTENDNFLRCTIVDADTNDMKVITSKRERRNRNNKKNKYRFYQYHMENEHEKTFCNLFTLIHNLVLEKAKKYEE